MTRPIQVLLRSQRSACWLAVISALSAFGCRGELESAGTSTPLKGSTPHDVPGGGTVTPGTPGGPAGPQGPKEPEKPLDPEALFTCDASQPVASEPRLRLVGRDEWRRNVGRWVDDQAEKNPFEPNEHHDYATYDVDEQLDEAKLGIYLSMVEAAADGWNQRSKTGNGRLKVMMEKREELSCFYDAGSRPDRPCIESFVRTLLERGVLYREPTTLEVKQIADFAELEVLPRELERSESVTQIVSAAWMMPSALFRPELGEGEIDDAGRVRLSDDELAQSIAYALGGRAAGALATHRSSHWYGGFHADPGKNGYSSYEEWGHQSDLARAARDGSIRDPMTIDSIVRSSFGGKIGAEEKRYDLVLETPIIDHLENASSYWVALGIRDFFRQWLEYDAIATAPAKASVTETSKYSGLSYEMSYRGNIDNRSQEEIWLVEQLDQVIARAIVEDRDVLKALLTTDEFYVPAIGAYDSGKPRHSVQWMAAVYGVDEPIGKERATRENRWIKLNESEHGRRGGVLTHPAWLASHGLGNENDPSIVTRGHWIREALLCEPMEFQPIDVDAMLDPETAHLSARARVQEKTEQEECVGCHVKMNPLGYPFEIYNHAGYVRVSDHEQAAPNGRSTLLQMPDPELEGRDVRDAVEMSALLAESKHVERCFIRQTFRYFSGRQETEADACTLTAMEEAYAEKGSFVDMLVALFTSDTFFYRWDRTEGARR